MQISCLICCCSCLVKSHIIVRWVHWLFNINRYLNRNLDRHFKWIWNVFVYWILNVISIYSVISNVLSSTTSVILFSMSLFIDISINLIGNFLLNLYYFFNYLFNYFFRPRQILWHLDLYYLLYRNMFNNLNRFLYGF